MENPRGCKAAPHSLCPSLPTRAPRRGTHFELGFGDLAALLHVQGGESVPDGLEQLGLQVHGCRRRRRLCRARGSGSWSRPGGRDPGRERRLLGAPPGPQLRSPTPGSARPRTSKSSVGICVLGREIPALAQAEVSPLEGIGGTRRAEAQTEASSQATAVPCLQKPLPLGWPKLCKLLWDGQKSDPRYCREPAPGSGSQLDSRISKVSPSCVPPAPGAVEGLKAPLGAGHQPGSLSPARGRMEDGRCVHRHNSLNLGLQGSLEEPRADVRFQGHVLAPPSHTLRAHRAPSPPLGQLLLWQDVFGQSQITNLLNVLNSYSC